MGYACPVCDTPQRDAEHLANHLAFTAMLHGDAHETWLDDHVPEWGDAGAAELAPVVADHAEETTYEEVFEDTVHDHDASVPDGAAGNGPAVDAGGELDAEARRTLATAREMTRAMLDDDDDGKA